MLKRVLKKKGEVIFVVPNENSFRVDVNDINMPLDTWTPQNLANLFRAAGYKVVEAECIKHSWPPMYDKIEKVIGWKGFHLLCQIWCRIRRSGYQTRVVAVLKE